ncbi:MAG: CoA-binding protein [Ignavibacteriaceae bacterium]|nr:CoA-binding protein [Ignavibacteriaceae bacterium]NUM70052.1 CoA-binding protein [Ignavibacteriaceae bacterium]
MTCEILKTSKKICVLGISNRPDRDSGRIALFLKDKGYSVTGVHPSINEYEGIKVYQRLQDVPHDIDILDVFISSDKIPGIIDEVLEINPKVVWLQLGIRNDEAVKPLIEKGITVIQDECIAIHYRMCNH